MYVNRRATVRIPGPAYDAQQRARARERFRARTNAICKEAAEAFLTAVALFMGMVFFVLCLIASAG